MTLQDAKVRRTAPLRTPSNLSSNSVKLISAALTEMLADMFALYLKTKNFHWHVSGPHFRDDHRMLDEQGAQILATTDAIAERVRKVGGTTIRSIGHISRLQRVWIMMPTTSLRSRLAELRDDNLQLAARMREIHRLCDENGDVASASVIEPRIDEAEGRTWFLFESTDRRPREGIPSQWRAIFRDNLRHSAMGSHCQRYVAIRQLKFAS